VTDAGCQSDRHPVVAVAYDPLLVPISGQDCFDAARRPRDVHDDLAAEQSRDEQVTCTARLDPRTKASRGERLRLVVDPASLYFFDPESETALR